MGKVFFYCLFFIYCFFGYSQTPDVFRAEYMLLPKTDVGNRTSRIKLVANVPIKVFKKDVLVVGAEYNQYDYEIPSTLTVEAQEALAKFYVVDLNFGYVLKWNDDWRFIGLITPRWASNFSIEFDKKDFKINATVGAFKEKKDVEKPFRLVLGLSYNNTSSIRVPLPFVYYEKRFHKNWSYTLGVPKTGLKYFLKKDHFFQTELILDGYYVNIQNDILLDDNSTSTDVSSTSFLATIGYQHKITKDISVYLMGGHSIIQNGTLRDTDRNSVFILNNKPGFYFRTGIRIGI
ncbi:hypothetical protein CLV91_2460 [Maribacter vaceletii]|uniref:DUF6268 domain-containing protein n=1 Tax=Maribacter vaceletii TaxID=1206816 RepID=A0A495E5W9_9FLAO|nr:DUF6268 family outer membrane beta-barrel protein [Maribacter vaceletii]RKR12334.1 hypothetical protein CLV91_2460 [Maribacter vaceletii]